jgi:hypothetical protein
MNKHEKVMIDIEKVRKVWNEHQEKAWELHKNGSETETTSRFIGINPFIQTMFTELDRLQKKEVPMKPFVDDEQPYCPICKTDLYYGKGIMNKYTDLYCIKCGQKLDWSDKK